MPVVDVVWISGQCVQVGEQARVEPGMHFQTTPMSFSKCQREWIEVLRLILEFDRTRFPAGLVVGIAATSHLHN